MSRLFYAFILLFATLNWGQSQTRVTLKKSDLLTSEVIGGQKIDKIIGDVWLQQGSTDIYCDSAYLFKDDNSAKAFGRVRIIDLKDSLDLSGDYMEYEGNVRIAHMRRNVILKDDSANLYTNFLDYDRNTGIGYYFNGGKLVDSTNVLTSKRGYYNTANKEAQFIDEVELTNPDYYLESDTLDYSTLNKVAITRGRTLAVSAENDTLTSTVGVEYRSLEKYSEVYYGKILTADYEIAGDTLIADDSTKYYQGMQNVMLHSFEDSLTIYGNQVIYDKPIDKALAYDEAYLRKMMNGDSLFIKADTLLSIQNDSIGKYLSAFHQVKMFKSDLQALADSAAYNLSDSTIYLYESPILWNVDSQITSDSIRITTANNRIHRMYLTLNSFVISKDSLLNYNQVKGRDMKVYFEEGLISRADVFGNGESIYFVNEKGTSESSMNKLKCSNMSIYFKDSFVEELRTYREVDGDLIPPFEVLEPEKKLRGFIWRITEKPSLASIIRRYRYDR